MYSTCEENLLVEKILAVTKWTLPVITSFCHRVGEKVCAVYSGSLDKYSPFDSPTSQFTKLAFPELTDDCIQNPPLLIAAPSLRFISAQDSAGNSGIEPRGTRGKIKKNKRKKGKKQGREKIKTACCRTICCKRISWLEFISESEIISHNKHVCPRFAKSVISYLSFSIVSRKGILYLWQSPLA